MTCICRSRDNEALNNSALLLAEHQSLVASAGTEFVQTSEERARGSGGLNDPAWAWAPYTPGPAQPWNLKWAGHLYRRAAFGADWEQLQQALKEGPQATIDRLLGPGPKAQDFDRAQDDYEQAAAQSGSIDSLRAWWLRRMCQTPFPLLEKLTLFWHGFFALSSDSVSNTSLMCRYLRHLRLNALGDLGRMLEGILNEPAVFAALNTRTNTKRARSENLARVLLEQFTVGRGNFNGADVQAAAQALTGWFVSQSRLQFSEREHVSTPGTLFGETGAFNKHDLVRILLGRKATAETVVRRLYRSLISETSAPSGPLLAPLVDSLAKTSDIARLVETMLRSNLFFSTAAYRQKIKSPVEFALGIIRPLHGMIGTIQLGTDLAGLGQELLNPPPLEGWVGHTAWINRFTVIARARLADALLAPAGVYGGKLDVRSACPKTGGPGSATANEALLELFLQGDVPAEVRRALAQKTAPAGAVALNDAEQLRRAAVEIASLPEFHLA